MTSLQPPFHELMSTTDKDGARAAARISAGAGAVLRAGAWRAQRHRRSEHGAGKGGRAPGGGPRAAGGRRARAREKCARGWCARALLASLSRRALRSREGALCCSGCCERASAQTPPDACGAVYHAVNRQTDAAVSAASERGLGLCAGGRHRSHALRAVCGSGHCVGSVLGRVAT